MESAQRNRGDRGAGVLACAIAAALAFSFAFTPLRSSHDEFWHLKTGRWIAEHGRLPENDIFTYTAADFPWHNHEWLTQLAMWKLWEAFEQPSAGGGWRAVIAAKGFLILLAYAGLGWAAARSLKQPAWAGLAAAIGVMLARRTFYPRPPFVTYFLIAVVLWLLMDWRAGKLRARWLLLLPPLFALWTNLHGGWMAGLVVGGAFWADAVCGVLAARLAAAPTGDAIRKLKTISIVGGACLAATLCNPYGWLLYALPGRVMSDSYLVRVIGEMQPPPLRFVWSLPGAIALLALATLRPTAERAATRALIAAGTLAVVMALGSDLLVDLRQGWNVPPAMSSPQPWLMFLPALPLLIWAPRRANLAGWPAHSLLLVFFGCQAVFHARHLSLFGLVLIPTLAGLLDAWADALRRRYAEAEGFPFGGLAAALTLALALFSVLHHREGYSFVERNRMLTAGVELQPIPVRVGDRYVMAEDYPKTAVDFLLRNNLPAPLFNGGNYAGYLIWRLAPEKYKVFTDNRYDIYGGAAIRDENSALGGFDEGIIAEIERRDPLEQGKWRTWSEVLEHWKARTVFIKSGERLNSMLEQSGAWTKVYQDPNWSIWLRRN